MKNILIVGSGPVGLYTAIRLKKRYGSSVNVTVIDPHLYNYERPGIIAKMAVDAINRSFDVHNIEQIYVPDSGGYPENSVFIGQLQQQLLIHAKKQGVTLEQARFSAIEKQQIIVNSNNVSRKELPCDLLIDCSGERRVVATYANHIIPDAFKIKPMAKNPIESHFIAYVHMDDENASKVWLQDFKDIQPLSYVKNMEHLRKSFGWSEYALPEITTSRWKMSEGGIRYCFYFEIPPKLLQDTTTEEQENYLKALLKLRCGNDIHFQREYGMLKFIPFEVSPKTVENPIKTIVDMPIALCGDARMSPEYRFGTGVQNGIECASALIQSIEVNSKGISVNRERYEFLSQPTVKRHEKEVQQAYQSKKNILLDENLLTSYKIYCLAYDQAMSPADQLIVSNGLTNMANKFKLAADTLYLEAIAMSSSSFQNKMSLAEAFYMRSLELYKRFCPEERMDEKWDHAARVYSNLAKLSNQCNDLEQAIERIIKAMEISKTYNIVAMIPRTQLTFHDLLIKKHRTDCSKLDSKKDDQIIQEKDEQLALNLTHLSQEASDPALKIKCLTNALLVYKKHDSVGFLQKKIAIYDALIQVEEEPLNKIPKETIILHIQELNVIKGLLIKETLTQRKNAGIVSEPIIKFQ